VRVRLLHPGFFKNEQLATLPFAARLLYAGLWGVADREGRLEDRPPRLKVELFPYDDIDVHALLDELACAGFIRRYEVDGWRLIYLPTFRQHQKPHLREQASKLPDPKQARAPQHHQGSANGHNLDRARAHANRGADRRADPDPVRDPDPGADPIRGTDPVSIADPDRADVSRETGQTGFATLIAIVRQSVLMTMADADEDELIETAKWHAEQRGVRITTEQAREALTIVLADRKAAR